MKAKGSRGPVADHAAIAIELLRALRGRRSQTAFSKRLGYHSNIVQRWESGQSLPTAARFLQACTRQGLDVEGAFERFYGRRPGWLKRHAADSDAAVAAFLSDLQGKVAVTHLARAVGTNRYTMARWLKGQAHPRLHEFLALVEASSRRLLDFVATLVDPANLPSLAERWDSLQRSREAAYATPWSHAVLRALELPAVAKTGATRRFLRARLGISADELERTLAALAGAGQLLERAGRLRAVPLGDVDTGRDAARARQLKAHWTQTALERLENGSPGLFGYALFAISREDLRRLREVQLEYVRQINLIVSESSAEQCVGLFCTQLLDLSPHADNALG